MLCSAVFHARGDVTCVTGAVAAGAVADFEQGAKVERVGGPPVTGCGVLSVTSPGLWASLEGLGGIPGGHTYPIWSTVSGAAAASLAGLGSPNITTLAFSGSANAKMESMMIGIGLFGSIQVVVDVTAASSGGCTLNLTKRTVVRIAGSPASVSGGGLGDNLSLFSAGVGSVGARGTHRG